MLNVDVLAPDEAERAASIFHRDGFVAIGHALTPEQVAFARAGAERVCAEQIAEAGRNGNRGVSRYSFGDQVRHPEWAMLVDLPTILPTIEAIWGDADFTCSGAGGDYSAPGAEIQALHRDMGDFFKDPLGAASYTDVPAPFIVVNFLITEFTERNGPIRFVPGTQRAHQEPPPLHSEPEWMRNSTVCAPAGTAIVRDVRCWHGGTANRSEALRIMTSTGYYAPWYRARTDPVLPREMYEKLSERARELCRLIVAA